MDEPDPGRRFTAMYDAHHAQVYAYAVSLAVELRAWVDDAAADVADGVTERQAMLAALATLRDDDRELLTLIAWHGLTPRQAALVVGCSVATYFVRLHRARKRLQEALSSPIPVADRWPRWRP